MGTVEGGHVRPNPRRPKVEGKATFKKGNCECQKPKKAPLDEDNPGPAQNLEGFAI